MAIRLPDPPLQYAVDHGWSEDHRQLEHWREALYRQLELVGSVTGTPGLIGAGAVGTLTITVTGCMANMAQSVAIGAPSGIDAGLVWCGVISADDTVTVRILNTTGGGITPSSAQWTARVFL